MAYGLAAYGQSAYALQTQRAVHVQKSFQFRPDDTLDLNSSFGLLKVRDPFSRTSTDTFGSADLGGAYTHSGGLTNFDIAGGWGTMSVAANASREALLLSTTWQDQDLLVRVKADRIPVAGNVQIYTYSRYIGVNDRLQSTLRLKPVGSNMTIQLVKVIGGGVSTVVGEYDLGFETQADEVYWIRTRAIGTSPTLLLARVWKDGTPEPWSFPVVGNVSDSSVQAAGAAGLAAFAGATVSNGPVLVSWDELEGVAINDAAVPALNANLTPEIGSTFRLRTEISNSGSASIVSGYHLYYSKNGGAYTRVTTSSDVRSVVSDRYADGAVTAELGMGQSGSFVPGYGDEDSAVATVTVPPAWQTEHEWALKIVTAAGGDTFDFRVYRDDGSPLDTYDNTARATAASSLTAVGVSKVLPYGMQSVVGVSRSLPSSVQAPVGASKALPAAVNAAIGSSKSMPYGVLAAVGKSVALPASVLVVVGSSKSVPYSALALVGVSRALPASVLAALSRSMALSYSVHSFAGASKALPSAVLATAGASKSTPYSVAALVGATKSLPYGVSGSVGASKALPYGVLVTVGASKALPSSVQAFVAASKALPYSVTVIVGESKALPYGVAGVVGSSQILPYGVAAAVGRSIVLPADVLVVSGSSYALSYSSVAFVGASSALPYAVAAFVGTSRALPYSMVAAVGKSVELTYGVSVITFTLVPNDDISNQWTIVGSGAETEAWQVLDDPVMV